MHPAPVDRRWPWGVAGLAVVLTVAGAPLAVANVGTSGIERVYIGDAIAGTVVPAAGALILSRTGHRIGWVLLSTAGLAVSFFLAEWASFGLHTAPGSLPLAAWAGWIAEVTWVPFLGVLTLLPLWFPTGRVPSRRWLPLQVWVLGLLALILVACLLHPRLADGTPAPLTAGLPDWTLGVSSTATTVLVFTAIACLVSLGVRYARAEADDRRRLRWFAVAVAVAVGVTFLPGVPVPVSDVLTGIAFALVAAAVSAAVLGGLYGIDSLVNRSLVYAAASAVTYLLYVVVVTSTGSLLPDAAGFVGVAAVAVAFAPARTLATRAVDRALHGARSDPLAALASLDEQLDGRADGGRAGDGPVTAVEAVRESLRVPWAAVVEEDPAGVERVVVESGQRPDGPTVRLPMTAHGHRVGTLVAALRPTEESLDDRDHHLLAAFARTLGGALHGARLAADLQQTRERLVLAQEEERRRLHRDLHDGLGPVLSHAVLGLDGVRRDLPAPSAGLAAVKENLQQALVDLRRLVQGLRPPALDEGGLGGALAQHVGLLAAGGPTVVLAPVDVPDDLPAAVEVAAYRIATEALVNVTRHAAATRCDVGVRVDDDHLVLTVTDDGRGLPAGPSRGVGLDSMRERAEELGGRLTIGTDGGGTVVEARLPVNHGR